MGTLVDWLNESSALHPVLKSGVAQFQLVHIHPFRDGNGRTSRLLSTLCMYRAGYDFKRLFTISEFYDRDRQAFYNAIQGVRDNDMNLTSWLEYFTRGLATQLVEVKQRGQRVIQIDLLAQKHSLNDRQKRLLGVISENPPLLLADLMGALTDVPRRTLQRDVKKLVDFGILESSGATRSLRYSLVKNNL
mgnify:CR=1 FL=1